MKTIVTFKSLISGSLILLVALLSFTWASQTSAHPPRQEGEQPAFTGSVQSSADGSATIASQETQLDAAYFGANGQLEGLAVTSAGLALAPDTLEGSYTSGTILSPLGFTTDIVPLWGADLPEGTNLRLETRLSSDGGASWSDWVENPEAFYPVRDDLRSGNLIWAGSEQVALQFKVTLHSGSLDFGPALRSVTLVFSDTSQGPTDGEIAGQMAEVSAAAQVCPIKSRRSSPRTTWAPDGRQSPPPAPVCSVTHIIIHQEPGNPQPAAALFRLVPVGFAPSGTITPTSFAGVTSVITTSLIPKAKIYEGRAGGDDVIGIHDTHNRGSMAIGFIGCYGNCDDPRLGVAQPDEAMLKSAEDLIAWKLQQKGIDPLSSAAYDGLANVPVVAGGRDVTWTTSPGDHLYNRLPDLRTKASERIKSCSNPQACQITGVIFGKESYTTGETVSFTVRLADFQGLPLVGATVTATKTVSAPPVGALASTGFGFVDRAGEYDGQDPETSVPGLYTYTFTASDPNQRFLPCSATASIEVKGSGPVTATPTSTATPTATPTGTPPTVTPTPTNTPTPTTTPPTGTTVRVNPANLIIPVCSAQGTAAVEVVNVTNMLAVQLQLRYNPSQAQVIDADPARAGIQVIAGSIFSTGFIAQNSVDTNTGVISFAATLLSGAINGNAELIRVNWQPVAAGSAPLSLENVILVNAAGQPISFTAQNGQLEVSPNCAGIAGILTLQGRTHHSGIVVVGSGGQQTQTQADGSFTVPAADNLKFSFPGYLSAQADVQTFLAQNQGATGQAVNLGSLTLLAGDLNADNRVDILDLATIAKVYSSGDTLADLNADGTVNILDLVLAAGNYGRQGPLTDWQ